MCVRRALSIVRAIQLTANKKKLKRKLKERIPKHTQRVQNSTKKCMFYPYKWMPS